MLVFRPLRGGGTAAQFSTLMDYKGTLHLPRTDFPMRASLPQREPEFLRRWDAADLYGQAPPLQLLWPTLLPAPGGETNPPKLLSRLLRL